MNYIDLKEAIKATGKSEKTIRRFLSKPESKAYVSKKGNKLVIEVNYLFATYPHVGNVQILDGQKLVNVQDVSMDKELDELKNRLALYEQEIQNKDLLLAEKDGRIMDLQKAMLLLESPKSEKSPGQKKRRWWHF